MRRACWWMAGCLAAAMPLLADWKVVTARIDESGRESVRTEYFKGNVERTDEATSGSAPLTWVIDSVTHQQSIWDTQAKQYVLNTPGPPVQPAAAMEQDARPRPVLHLDSDTVDTGERQTFFGRTARHLITTLKQSIEEEGAPEAQLQSETRRDGWYLADGPRGKKYTGLVFALDTINQAPPIIKQTRTGPALAGLIAEETTTRRLFRRDGHMSRFESRTAVKELYEGVLAQELFDPPSNYRRVDRLTNEVYIRQPSFSDELEIYWNNFEQWLWRLFS